jgi:uncharacterized membrane protein YhaH (DUF805 family)
MGPIDANKLWQNFMDTVQNHYMDFAGRVPRAQYWFFILVCVGVDIVAAILDAVVRTGLLGAVVGLALLLPMGGMTARRMQDTGRSGQMVWIWIIATAIFQVFALLTSLGGLLGGLAIVGLLFGLAGLISLLGLVLLVIVIALIYFCAQPGTAGDNAYGAVPPAWTPGPGTP